MVRTQIQISDELYQQAKRLAEEKEISLAEVVRRGLEHILRIHPPRRSEKPKWKLAPPSNTHLRGDPFADPDWRVNLNLSSAAIDPFERPQHPKRKRSHDGL
jgi:hypothetical protein